VIDWEDKLGSTNVRITFRTYKVYVQKLTVVARAHGFRLGARLSLGAALNHIIGRYDDTEETAKVASMPPEPEPVRRRKKRPRRRS